MAGALLGCGSTRRDGSTSNAGSHSAGTLGNGGASGASGGSGGVAAGNDGGSGGGGGAADGVPGAAGASSSAGGGPPGDGICRGDRTVSSKVELQILVAQGCREITGSLMIQASILLKELSGLETLESVGGALLVRRNQMLTSLAGLANVTSIGGTFEISDNLVLQLDDFTGERVVAGPLWIVNNPKLLTLGAGTFASVGGLEIHDNRALTSIASLEGVELTANNLRIFRNDQLTSLSALTGIDSVPGELFIGGLLLSSLAGLHDIRSVGLGVQVSQTGIQSLDELQQLSRVPGDLVIVENAKLLDIEGLAGITEVGGALDIADNDLLTSLEPLAGITTVPGGIRVTGAAITSLAGLHNLTTIGSHLTVSFTGIPSLAGLGKLTNVAGELVIEGNPQLVTLSGLSVLEHVELLTITENDALTSSARLPGPQGLGSLDIRGNDALESLAGLEDTLALEADVEITENAALEALTGLDVPVLRSLIIDDNPKLLSLAGLAGVTQISELELTRNSQLASLVGLEDIELVERVSITENPVLSALGPLLSWPANAVTLGLEIRDNPKLPQCQVDSFDAAQLESACSLDCLGNDDSASCN